MKFKLPATPSSTSPNWWISSLTFRPLFLIFALSLVGCASSPGPVVKKAKTYSEQTEKTFEEIEREQVLESYRQMRWDNWNERESERQRQQKRRDGRARVIKPRPMPKVAPKRPAPIRGDANEIQVEIEQNMALFCMKMDGKGRFSDDNDCSAFTENILYECAGKYADDDKRKVNCVKGALK